MRRSRVRLILVLAVVFFILGSFLAFIVTYSRRDLPSEDIKTETVVMTSPTLKPTLEPVLEVTPELTLELTPEPTSASMPNLSLGEIELLPNRILRGGAWAEEEAKKALLNQIKEISEDDILTITETWIEEGRWYVSFLDSQTGELVWAYRELRDIRAFRIEVRGKDPYYILKVCGNVSLPAELIPLPPTGEPTCLPTPVPSATAMPPTSTPCPPIATPAPSSTPVPSATATPLPTATPVPPTATPEPTPTECPATPPPSPPTPEPTATQCPATPPPPPPTCEPETCPPGGPGPDPP